MPDVVAEIKRSACIHGVLILYGCILSRFYGIIISQSMPSYTLGDLSVNRYLGACSHLTLLDQKVAYHILKLITRKHKTLFESLSKCVHLPVLILPALK